MPDTDDTNASVVTPRRIVDPRTGRVLYRPGDRVPAADAERFGLRAHHGPDEDRMRRPSEDR